MQKKTIQAVAKLYRQSKELDPFVQYICDIPDNYSDIWVVNGFKQKLFGLYAASLMEKHGIHMDTIDLPDKSCVGTSANQRIIPSMQEFSSCMQMEMDEDYEKFFWALERFGWEVHSYFPGSDDDVEDIDSALGEDFPKDAKAVLADVYQYVKEDNENDGYLTLWVLSNKQLGAYLKYVEQNPQCKKSALHRHINDMYRYVMCPLCYYHTDTAVEYVTEDKRYISTFTTGYCSGWEDYCNPSVAFTGAPLYAWYLQQYLALAENEYHYMQPEIPKKSALPKKKRGVKVA